MRLLTTAATLVFAASAQAQPPAALDPLIECSVTGDAAKRVCAGVADAYAALAEWNPEGIKSTLQAAGKQLGVKGRELFQPVRAALTGRTHGPELPLVALALGQQRSVSRLRNAASA